MFSECPTPRLRTWLCLAPHGGLAPDPRVGAYFGAHPRPLRGWAFHLTPLPPAPLAPPVAGVALRPLWAARAGTAGAGTCPRPPLRPSLSRLLGPAAASVTSDLAGCSPAWLALPPAPGVITPHAAVSLWQRTWLVELCLRPARWRAHLQF